MRDVKIFIRHKVLIFFYKIKVNLMGGECSTRGRNAKFRIEYATGKNLIVALHFVEKKTASARIPQSLSIIFRVGVHITHF
jgi:hypothetical protein